MGTLTVIPKVVREEAQGYALRIAGEMFLGAVAPEFFLPALAITEILGVVPGLPHEAKSYDKYLAVAKDFTATVDNVLDIIVKLQMLGIIPKAADDTTTLQQKLVDALYCVKEDGTKVGLACIIRETLSKEIEVSGSLQRFNVIDFLQNMLQDLRWTAPDGMEYPLGRSLGQLCFTGVISGYRPSN